MTSKPKPAPKVRADQLLVERGLSESRTRAQALIMSGAVHVDDRRIDKPGEQLRADAPIAVRGADHPYVSRGGVKLAGALDELAVDVRALVAVDIGASTGGFTDVLLQRDAAKVYAVDVGQGQLHQKLRADTRVAIFDRTNARTMTPETLGLSGPTVDLVVVDASFIGLDKLLPAIAGLLRQGGTLLALVKPQFQLEREQVGKGGVVRDDALRLRASEIAATAAREVGLTVIAETDCVLPGPSGNRERWMLARKA